MKFQTKTPARFSAAVSAWINPRNFSLKKDEAVVAAYDASVSSPVERERHLAEMRIAVTKPYLGHEYPEKLIEYCYRHKRLDYLNAICTEDALPQIARQCLRGTYFTQATNFLEQNRIAAGEKVLRTSADFVADLAEAFTRQPKKLKILGEAVNEVMGEWLRQGQCMEALRLIKRSTSGRERISFRQEMRKDNADYTDLYNPVPDWVADGPHLLQHLDLRLMHDAFKMVVEQSVDIRHHDEHGYPREESRLVSCDGSYFQYPVCQGLQAMQSLIDVNGSGSASVQAARSGIAEALETACAKGGDHIRILPLYLKTIHSFNHELLAAVTPEAIESFVAHSVKDDMGVNVINLVDILCDGSEGRKKWEEAPTIAHSIRSSSLKHGLLFAAPEIDFDFGFATLGVINLARQASVVPFVQLQDGVMRPTLMFCMPSRPIGVTYLDDNEFIGESPVQVALDFIEYAACGDGDPADNSRVGALSGLLWIAGIGWPEQRATVQTELTGVLDMAAKFNAQALAALDSPAAQRVIKNYADFAAARPA